MIPYISESKEELVGSDVFYSYEKLNNIKWYDRILLNRPLKVTIVFLLIGIATPLLLYHFYFFIALNLAPSDGFSIGSCLIPRETRLACGVGQMPPEECHTCLVNDIDVWNPEAQQTAENTRFLTPFSLVIALECTGNETTTCRASGKQFITKKMSLIFTADDKELTVTAEGEDFDPICDLSSGIWAYDIQFINIYGLAEHLNNFDNFRQLDTFVDLCHLEMDDKIVVKLVA